MIGQGLAGDGAYGMSSLRLWYMLHDEADAGPATSLRPDIFRDLAPLPLVFPAAPETLRVLTSPVDSVNGVLLDTPRRDVLIGSGQLDVFDIRNDGRTDTILKFEDGVDLIDLRRIDARFDELSIRQFSLTEYRIDYLDEERIFVTFETPAPSAVPASGSLLDESDFLIALGLATPAPQIAIEASTSAPEVLFGTTLPDVFIFDYDGERDTVRRFEPGKDRIDLAAYGVTFGELEFNEWRPGRISVLIPPADGVVDPDPATNPNPTAPPPPDWLVIIDESRSLTIADLTADMFIF